jgi:hypothetical protein
MRFEWDERKPLANLTKHGLDFRRAVQVFGRRSFTYLSQRQDEERWVTVGEARGRLGRGGVDMAIRRHPRHLHEEGPA